MRAERTLAHALIALRVTQRRAAALDVVRPRFLAVSRSFNIHFAFLTPHAAAVQLLLRQLVETLSQVIFLRDRKSTRLNSSHSQQSRMPSSA